MSVIAENVARGVALLDSKVPDWRSKIDERELCMADMFNCILGQVFGSFGAGLKSLHGVNISTHEAWQFGVAHGFDASTGSLFDKLEAEWRKHLSDGC